MHKMLLQDFIKFALSSVLMLRLRSFLTALGIAIGIASVVLLTSLGKGVYQFVLSEFTQFGTNLIGVTPGKTTTAGISGAVISNVRPLTLDDVRALERLPDVAAVVPVVQGNASVETHHYQRRTMILGVNHQAPHVWQINLALGRNLPDDDPASARAYAILGSKVYTELFKNSNPLGQRIRIAGERYRVIGVMESKGQLLGFDMDDTVYIPAAKALEMFNRESLVEIDILGNSHADIHRLVKRIKQQLLVRHGHEDFTVTTQEEMLNVLKSLLNTLTLAVGALGGISLLVGSVGIFTIMTISVKERTAEIGVLRAIGANRRQILGLFVTEAMLLSSFGGIAGLLLGISGAKLLNLLVPAMPTSTSWTYVLLAELLALIIGLLAGVMPAHHAARLDPVDALRAE